MSAAEVIEQVKRLPADERAEVARFIEQFDEEPTGNSPVRYIGREEAREASARIFEKHAELFRKLAQ